MMPLMSRIVTIAPPKSMEALERREHTCPNDETVELEPAMLLVLLGTLASSVSTFSMPGGWRYSWRTFLFQVQPMNGFYERQEMVRQVHAGRLVVVMPIIAYLLQLIVESVLINPLSVLGWFWPVVTGWTVIVSMITQYCIATYIYPSIMTTSSSVCSMTLLVHQSADRDLLHCRTWLAPAWSRLSPGNSERTIYSTTNKTNKRVS